MRLVSVLVSIAVFISCLPAYSLDAKKAVDDREVAVQELKESINDLSNLFTELKGLKSIILAVTYSMNYKRENTKQIENEILQALTVKLRAAGIKVQTYPQVSKQIDARMQTIC